MAQKLKPKPEHSYAGRCGSCKQWQHAWAFHGEDALSADLAKAEGFTGPAQCACEDFEWILRGTDGDDNTTVVFLTSANGPPWGTCKYHKYFGRKELE